MTMMENFPYTCSVCGGTTSFQTVISTNAFGSADLDLRPPEMQRSTMPAWVQTCPHCGFAAGQISRETSATREFLASAEYASLTDVTGDAPKATLPVLAREFYMASKCDLADGNDVAATHDLLHAAWACDDAGDAAAGYARRFRVMSADLFEEMLAEVDAEEADDDDGGQPEAIRVRLMVIDLLRRAGELDRAAARCSETKRLLSTMECDRTLALVTAYEQDLIDKGDTGGHTVQEAVEAEATLRDILDEIGKRIRS